jgi:1,4-alpha-glucan branching enzyme
VLVAGWGRGSVRSGCGSGPRSGADPVRTSVLGKAVTGVHDPWGGLTGQDLAEFHAGQDTACWRLLGSHVVTIPDDDRGEVRGTRFAVWAPDAQAVRVKGDFNSWAGDPLSLVPGAGVWALFVEGVDEGALYRYDVLGADGVWREKSDPMARFAETAPSNASIVHESTYAWGDDDWMSQRRAFVAHESPLAIYEVHLGSWREGRTYLDLADELVEYVTSMGYTHVEFMPVTEHPLVASWGYQVTGFFAPQSRLGRPDELRHLIDRLHQAGIGVILDWVPGHFPKDDWALGRFDGTALYEHPDERRGEHKEWGTYVFNFGRHEVASFLLSSALYWAREFHFDALRVDAVASMVYLDYGRQPGQWEPNRHGGNEYLEAIDFLRTLNAQIHEQVPGVMMIAEESTAFHGVTRPVSEGGLGFDFKWNMGWMNDTLRYLALDPFHRQYDHHDMTFAMLYQYTEHYILPISHDEVVHGKGSMVNKIPQDSWRQFATLRAYYSFMCSWDATSVSDANGARSPASSGGSPTCRTTAVCSGSSAISTRCTGGIPPSGVSTANRPASAGSTTTTPGPIHSPGCAPTGMASRSRASSTSRRSPGRITASACRRPARGWRSSTPTTLSTAGPGPSATTTRSRPSPRSTTTSRPVRRSSSHRWERCSSSTNRAPDTAHSGQQPRSTRHANDDVGELGRVGRAQHLDIPRDRRRPRRPTLHTCPHWMTHRTSTPTTARRGARGSRRTTRPWVGHGW